MRNDKHIALKMRQNGKSYKEIRKELGIPLSTISDWFSGQEWSQNLRKELIRRTGKVVSKIHKKRWEQWREAARQEAHQEFHTLKHDPLFIAGLMLYWGEGDSKLENCKVRLTNTNADMMRVYVQFLRKICCVPVKKIRVGLLLYPDLHEKSCKEFWSSKINLPQQQFEKTQVIKGKHPTKRLANGICMVSVASRQLKEKVFVWIDRFHSEFPLHLAES